MKESVFTFPSPPAAGEGDRESAERSREERLGMLEAVIFAAEEPPSAAQLAMLAGVSEATIREDIGTLMEACQTDRRGVEIRAIGGTYRISTKPAHHRAVRAFASTVRPMLRLSRAALETLAVVAYKQPVTLPEINAIRGVTSSSGVMRTLLGHALVAIAGRKRVVGRPICYKTTPEFLERFGLDDVSELPTVKELEELAALRDGVPPQLELLPGPIVENPPAGDGPEPGNGPSS